MMGRVRLLAFHCGGEVVTDPATGDASTAPYFFYAVQHPRGLVLFDCGGHPALIDDPVGHLGPEVATQFEVLMAAGDDAATKLGTAGLDAASVTHVVQSHLHYDHAGGLSLFPHAPVYVQRAELDAMATPPAEQAEFYAPADIAHGPAWVAVDGEHDLFGDGSLVLFPTPGHTAGHQSLLVRLPSRTVILAADAAYRPEQFEQRVLSSVYSDADAMLASYERLAALRDELGARILFTHDRAWRDSVRLAPARWYD